MDCPATIIPPNWMNNRLKLAKTEMAAGVLDAAGAALDVGLADHELELLQTDDDDQVEVEVQVLEVVVGATQILTLTVGATQIEVVVGATHLLVVGATHLVVLVVGAGAAFANTHSPVRTPALIGAKNSKRPCDMSSPAYGQPGHSSVIWAVVVFPLHVMVIIWKQNPPLPYWAELRATIKSESELVAPQAPSPSAK